MKTPSLVERKTIEVAYANGKTATYTSNAMDTWRLEQFTGQPTRELGFTEITFLAYSAAMRAGDAYKPRSDKKKPGEEKARFEAWLDGVEDVFIVVDEGGDAVPLDEPPQEKSPQ